jgi:hypothetical protein
MDLNSSRATDIESLLSLLPDSTAPVKLCACCGAHHTLAGWQGLRYLGDCGVPGRLMVEMRDCACGSSIAMPVRDRLEVVYEIHRAMVRA